MAAHKDAHPAIEEAQAAEKHLEKAPQAMEKDAAQGNAPSPFIGFFCPNGRILHDLPFPLGPRAIRVMLQIARQLY